MLCDNCERDLIRTFVGATGTPVNLLALTCLNTHLGSDGYYRSRCSKEETIAELKKWTTPKRIKDDPT